METVKTIAVVVNPVAGDHLGARVWPRIEQQLVTAFSNRDVSVYQTQSKEHATALGASLNADLVITVSGDGTVHDVAQGILQRPRANRPALTVIPIGSGNDYSRTLGISTVPENAVAALHSMVRCATDVGQCNNTFFLETLSFGVDAAIAINTVEMRKTTHTSGTMLYAHAAVLALLHDLRPRHARYTIDGVEHEDDLLIFAVQNGPTYGSGFRVAPRALITDGKLNVCTATRVSTPYALLCLARILRGTHEGLKPIHTYEAQNLTVDFDTPIPTQCDGEEQEGSRFNITIHPAALDVLVPPASPILL
ncbi:MAG: diacylglycerol kinase family lipid kinase [Coriobacteriales bacterium]|nr:diacylglycerol kinase family lipid kinase [Coriobacteriales bacterium]